MTSKRSYLDTLNAGRQRRPNTTIEQLNRSLETLEEQIHPSAAAAPGERWTSSRPRREWRDAFDSGRDRDPAEERRDTFGRERERDWPAPPESERLRAPPSARRDRSAAHAPGYPSLTEEIERARRQEESVTAAGRIAGELKGLRAELMSHEKRHEDLSTNLERELASLRREVGEAVGSVELNREFERLSGAVAALAERGDDRGVTMLRLELEQVRGALDQLAREESVRDVGQRWGTLERRLDTFEEKLGAERTQLADKAAVADLQARLDALDEAVRQLPSSFHAFEERIRTLAGAVDQIARQKDRVRPADLTAIEERLDEISRAIVASAIAGQPAPLDPEPFERIEARLAAVSRQMEDFRPEPDEEVMARLVHLSARVDELAGRAHLPEKAVVQLAQQVSIIAAKLDEAPARLDPDFLFDGIEQRFEALSSMLNQRQGDAFERSSLLFRDLERRLDEVADRVDEATRGLEGRDQALIGAIDQRLEDFSRRWEAQAPQNGEGKLIRSLEAQIAVLTEHLAKPGVTRGDMETIAPRLEGIERSLSSNRDTIVEAAREAAEKAVRALATHTTDRDAAAALAQDLKALEALTRRSDERNAKTFEAIHDTLIKIVDRLGAMERGEEPASPRPAVRHAIEDAPSLDAGEALPAARMPSGDREKQAASAALAAQAAAEAALDENEETAASGGKMRSMLGGLGRALGQRKPSKSGAPAKAAAPAQAEDLAPSIDLDEPLDPKNMNRPIEPNSKGPDLGAIMRRVRDERAQGNRGSETETAKSDFIAAARRAAQAAAAEAEVLKRGGDGAKSTSGGSRLGGLLSRHRKPILMSTGAVLLALMSLQLGRAYLTPEQEMAAAPPLPVESVAEAPLQAAAGPPQEVAAAEPQEVAAEAEASAMPPAEQPATPEAEPAPAEPAAAVAPAEPVAPSAALDSSAQAAGATVATTAEAPVPAATAAGSDALPAMTPPAEIEPVALREAAAGGDAKALFEVASRLADGRGVALDMPAAARWFEAAANLGFAPAQYRLGSLYEKGNGVTRDLAKARTLYQMAADAGNASAMHNLAVLYAMGADGMADNASAARWFAAAAELGVKDSQFNLGILAAKGVGMERNLAESYKWFALVGRAGDADAAAKRDEIANSLKPEELERARAAAELWKAKPLDPLANDVEIPESWQDTPATTASVDMTAAVKTIQLILNKNGYEAGGADGVMGGKTKAAIIAFQKDNELAPTGEVDEKLVQALLARK